VLWSFPLLPQALCGAATACLCRICDLALRETGPRWMDGVYHQKWGFEHDTCKEFGINMGILPSNMCYFPEHLVIYP